MRRYPQQYLGRIEVSSGIAKHSTITHIYDLSIAKSSQMTPMRETECRGVEIGRGIRPDIITAAIEMQNRYYTRTPGFSEEYESHLSSSLAQLKTQIDDKQAEVWSAKVQNRIVGTIFVVHGEDNGHTFARLTSFVVDDGFRGTGIGRQLLSKAIDYIEDGDFEECRLWTFEGSDAARRLYESVGFVLEKQFPGEFLSKQLMVQYFVRKHQTTAV